MIFALPGRARPAFADISDVGVGWGGWKAGGDGDTRGELVLFDGNS